MAEVGTYYITIMPEMSQFTRSVKSAISSAGTDSGKSYSTSFLDVVKGSALGSALGSLASKAGSAIASGFNTGISRLDTIKNYPKVMESLGYSTDAADKSIRTIMEHLDGLPTATQDMVTLTQAISDSTGDLDLATAAALGFNDMMLANGASTEEMATAQGVLNRVLGKGSATVGQWQSLTSVMPAQLNMVAKSMLGAGASSEDLHAALEDGTVSWNDFLQAIADLDKNGYIDEAGNKLASFEEQARANSHGIGTAIDNIKNRIGAGWAQILDKVGQEEISGTIDKMSYGIKDAMYRVADAVGYIKDAISKTQIGESLSKIFGGIGDAISNIDTSVLKTFADILIDLADKALRWIADHGEIVGGVLTMVAGAAAVLVGMNIGATIVGVTTALATLLEGLTLFGVISAGIPLLIGAIVAGLVYFFTQTETGKEIWQGFCDLLSGLWESLKENFDNMVKSITENWTKWSTDLSNLCQNIRQKVTQAWDAIKKGVLDHTKNMIKSASDNWTKWTTDVAKWNEDMKQKISDKWNEIKTSVSRYAQDMVSNTVSQWQKQSSDAAKWNEDMKQKITNKWNETKTSVANIGEAIRSSATDKWNSMKSNVTSAAESIKSSISDKFSSAKSTALSVFDSIKNGISDKMQWAKDKVSSIISSIKGLFNFSWSLPRPRIPNIDWHWLNIGGMLSIPVFDGISWFAKGGVFDAASIIGIGEKGREAALPLNEKTYGEIAKGITNELGTAGVTVTGNTFVVREEADIERIAEALDRKIRRERMAMLV